jgi:hypothetical protein
MRLEIYTPSETELRAGADSHGIEVRGIHEQSTAYRQSGISS